MPREEHLHEPPLIRTLRRDLPVLLASHVKDRDLGHRGKPPERKGTHVEPLPCRCRQTCHLDGCPLHDATRVEKAGRLHQKREQQKGRRKEERGLDARLAPLAPRRHLRTPPRL